MTFYKNSDLLTFSQQLNLVPLSINYTLKTLGIYSFKKVVKKFEKMNIFLLNRVYLENLEKHLNMSIYVAFHGNNGWFMIPSIACIKEAALKTQTAFHQTLQSFQFKSETELCGTFNW